MKYLFIPETYNYDLIESKFSSYNDFLSIQVKYRQGFEKILRNYIDFSQVDAYIKSEKIAVPIVDDKEYNFYHKYSSLGSNYIFIRNNIHVEALEPEEINEIRNSSELNIDFYKNTFSKVLYEKGNEVFYGMPIDENGANAKSLVFEFAYDQKKCKTIEELNKIHTIISKSLSLISSQNNASLNLPISYIVYKAVPDLYKQDDFDKELVL